MEEVSRVPRLVPETWRVLDTCTKCMLEELVVTAVRTGSHSSVNVSRLRIDVSNLLKEKKISPMSMHPSMN